MSNQILKCILKKIESISDDMTTTSGGGGSVQKIADSLAAVEVFKLCLVDDINNDGSNLIPFVRLITVDEKGTASILANFLPDLLTTYNPINPKDPDSIGTELKGKTGYVELSSGTWSPTPLVTSFTLRVKGTSNGSTLTDSFGITTTLDDNEVVSFDWHGELTDGVPVLTINGIIKITYTSY